MLSVRFTPVRAQVRHSDGPETVIAAYTETSAGLRHHSRLLAVAFALAAAAVIAAIVTVALEPRDVQLAAIAAPHVQSADPCDGQTWPRFTANCLASKSARPGARAIRP